MKTKNTGIRIEAVKEVSGTGNIGYRVTAITALPYSELPAMYLKTSRPAVYLDNEGDLRFLNCKHHSWLSLIFYPKKETEERLAHIKAAGQHLADVNRELAEKRKAWNGPVVFVDGVEVSKKSDLESESVPERISRFWVAGNLFFRTEEGFIESFPKPEVEKRP